MSGLEHVGKKWGEEQSPTAMVTALPREQLQGAVAAGGTVLAEPSCFDQASTLCVDLKEGVKSLDLYFLICDVGMSKGQADTRWGWWGLCSLQLPSHSSHLATMTCPEETGLDPCPPPTRSSGYNETPHGHPEPVQNEFWITLKDADMVLFASMRPMSYLRCLSSRLDESCC